MTEPKRKSRLFASLFASLLALAGPVRAEPLPPDWLLTAYYRPEQVLLVEAPGFAFVNMTMHWGKAQAQPAMILTYHRAITYPERQMDLHFSLTLRHYPQNRQVKADQPCQVKETRQSYRHPQLGPYLICSQEIVAVSKVSGASREPLRHQIARLLPLPGNKAPHVQIYVDAFGNEILPIAASLHSLGP